MANLSVGLSLTDQLTGPASRQAAAMGKVTDQVIKAGSALAKLDKHTGPGLGRVASQAERVTKGFGLMSATLSRVPIFGRLIGDAEKFGSVLQQRFGNSKVFSGLAGWLGGFSDKLGKMGLSMGGVAELGFGAIATGATAAIAAVAGVALAVGALTAKLIQLGIAGTVAFAKMAITTGMEREDSLVALTAMLKSEGRAKQVYGQAIKLAADTPFETQDVINSFQQLLGGGFNTSELDSVVRSLSDLAAIKGAAALPAATEALVKLRGSGKLTDDILDRFQTAGLGRAQIAKTAGVDVSKLSSLTGKEAEAVIMKAIADNFGGAAKEKSGALSGLLSTLVSRPMELFNKALDVTGGGLATFYASVKNSVKWLTNAFNPDSPTGRKVVAFMNQFGQLLTPIVTSLSGFGQGFIEGFLESFNGFGEGVKTSGADMKALGMAAGQAAAAIANLATWAQSLSSRSTYQSEYGRGLGVGVGDNGSKFIGDWMKRFGDASFALAAPESRPGAVHPFAQPFVQPAGIGLGTFDGSMEPVVPGGMMQDSASTTTKGDVTTNNIANSVHVSGGMFPHEIASLVRQELETAMRNLLV